MPTFFFLNKIFLLGLLAAAIPLLIHLFARRKARKLRFSSVSFIRDVVRRETRRLRVRNILLLLLRTAAVSAFALAAARPAIRGPLAKTEGSTVAVVVLDNSASMGSIRDGKTLFDRARDVALSVFDNLAEDDSGALLEICDAPEDAFVVTGRSRLTGMVGLAAPSRGSGAPRRVLERAGSLLRGSKNINRELYVVSDFQKSQWSEFLVFPYAVGGFETILIPVAGTTSENLSVQYVDLIRGGTDAGQTLEFALANHGKSAARAVPVSVLTDGAKVAESYIDVEPGNSVRTSVGLTGNFREIKIALPPDALAADDTYFVAVEPARQTRVVILGEDGSVPEKDFLSLALLPGSVSPGTEFSGFVPRRLRSGDIDLETLREAQCVILDNVSSLSNGELELLTEYRNSGGKLLVVLGDRVDIRYYNEKLLPGLFPATLVGVEGDAGPDLGDGGSGERGGRGFFFLRAAIATHPILRDFNVSRGETISEARFRRVIKAVPAEGSTVILQFSPGLPALIERNGALLFTSSFAPEWNDIVTSNVFVPLLHEALAYLCGAARGSGPGVFPGEMFEENRPPGEHLPFTVRGPVGRDEDRAVPRTAEEPPARDRAGPEAAIPARLGPFDVPGTYRLYAGDREIRAFSVNVDPRESDLEPLTKRELVRLVKGATVLDSDSMEGTVVLERSGRELWPLFLVLSLGLLVAELLVARSAAPLE